MESWRRARHLTGSRGTGGGAGRNGNGNAYGSAYSNAYSGNSSFSRVYNRHVTTCMQFTSPRWLAPEKVGTKNY